MPEDADQAVLRTTVSVRPEGQVIVRVTGELDLGSVTEFLAAIDEAIDRDPSSIELDLGDLAFMDSSGVGAYVDAFRRARARSVILEIGDRSPPVERVLELSGVEEALAQENRSN